MMGSPESEEGRKLDEGSQHHVTIAKPFFMGKYEVTNAQFRRFYEKHNSRWPAVLIHWKHTEWFCTWLNERLDGKIHRATVDRSRMGIRGLWR